MLIFFKSSLGLLFVYFQEFVEIEGELLIVIPSGMHDIIVVWSNRLAVAECTGILIISNGMIVINCLPILLKTYPHENLHEIFC